VENIIFFFCVFLRVVYLCLLPYVDPVSVFVEVVSPSIRRVLRVELEGCDVVGEETRDTRQGR
jgi:hypothetical protein